jgi:hypothetical protein
MQWIVCDASSAVAACPFASQASPRELTSELKAMGAFELDGYMRTADPVYLGQLLELIILR